MSGPVTCGRQPEETAATSEQEWARSLPRAADHRWRHTLYPLHRKLREKLCPLYRMS